MKKHFILFAIIVTILPAAAQNDTTCNQTATLYNYSYQRPVSQDNVNKLVEIENTLYGQVYNEQNLLSRIERLENTVYNRYYPDYTIDRRLNNLIYSYNRRYRTGNRTSRLGNALNRFNSAFVGVPTGFTPPISTDPYYNYYNPGYGRYNSSFGSNGWRTYGSSFGSGTGVHILD